MAREKKKSSKLKKDKKQSENSFYRTSLEKVSQRVKSHDFYAPAV